MQTIYFNAKCLAQLNPELERPKKKAAGQFQKMMRNRGREDRNAPVREPSALSVVGGDKPSIQAAPRAYIPPARAADEPKKCQRSEKEPKMGGYAMRISKGRTIGLAVLL